MFPVRSLNRLRFLEDGAGDPKFLGAIRGRGAGILATEYQATFKAQPVS